MSHNILITLLSAPVDMVDSGHISRHGRYKIAARVQEFIDMPKESSPGEEVMGTATTPGRPPFPPFTRDSAMQKVRLAEDAWNTRDPAKVGCLGSPSRENVKVDRAPGNPCCSNPSERTHHCLFALD
jgi:hypothetical protein